MIREGASVMRSSVGAVLLLGLCYIGYFKGTAPFRAIPFDATLGLAIAVCLAVAAHAVRRRAIDRKALAWIAGLWILFSIGAAMVLQTGRGYDKVAMLITVTLLCAAAPCCFLSSERSQRVWLGGVLTFAGVMAAAVVVAPDLVAQQDYGRLQLEGAVTIGSSRVVGAGIVVAFVLGVTARAWRWVWLSASCAGTGVLIAIGSRGPFLALLISIVAVLLLARVFRGRRTSAFAITGTALLVVAWALTTSGSRAAARIVRALTGEEVDVSREFLIGQAWQGIVAHPLGIGWGGFGALPPVARVYGNEMIYPHNIVLEITLESGWLVGLAFVALALVSVVGYVRASHSPEAAALLGLGIYWLLVAQTSSDVNGNRMTWATLTIGLIFFARGRGGVGKLRPLAPRGGSRNLVDGAVR